MNPTKRVAIVAVETNLMGRTVTPPDQPGEDHLWPFGTAEDSAEIVGAFVGDLDEGGEIKFVLCGSSSGRLKRTYLHGFVVKAEGRSQ